MTVAPELDPELEATVPPSVSGATPLEPPTLASSSAAPELPFAPPPDEEDDEDEDAEPEGPSLPPEPLDEPQWKDEDAMAASAIAARTDGFFMMTPGAGTLHFIAVTRG
jgi:hypothetical protein